MKAIRCLPLHIVKWRLFDRKVNMLKLSKCMFNLGKIRMDYSCHGRYKGIHVVFSLFSLLSS